MESLYNKSLETQENRMSVEELEEEYQQKTHVYQRVERTQLQCYVTNTSLLSSSS